MKRDGNGILIVILVVCFLARALFAVGTHAFRSDDYWEYGKIARNLYYFGEYSYYTTAGGTLQEDFRFDQHKQPSAFMLPGYPLFLYPYLAIENNSIRAFAILSSQWLLATLCCYLLFGISRRIFGWSGHSSSIALVAALIYALSPDCIYGANSYTPTIFAHLGCLLIAWSWFNDHSAKLRGAAMFLGSALLISMRAEVLLFLAILTIVAWFRERRQLSIMIVVGVACVLVPWTIRNMTVFSSPVPLSTTGGLNFYMGHNPGLLLDRSDSALAAEINHLPDNPRLELQIDSLYKVRAWQTIRNEPGRQAWLSVLKFFHLWVGNFGDPRARNPASFVPWLFTLGFVLYGWWNLRRAQHVYSLPLSLWALQYTFSSVLFFAIPRYQTMMKVAILPLSAYGMVSLYFLWKQRKAIQHSA